MTPIPRGQVSLCFMVTWSLVLFLSADAQAHWVKFIPCGFKMTEEGLLGHIAGPAPNIDVIWVWVPHVVSILDYKEREQDRIECTVLNTVGGRLAVIGSGEEVHRRLIAP